MNHGRWSAQKKASEHYATGENEDHGMGANEVCGWCGNTGLRFHFVVAHKESKERINVGSVCIMKFDIPLLINGRLVFGKERNTGLEKLMEETRRKNAIEAIEELCYVDSSRHMDVCFLALRDRTPIPPRSAAIVLWLLSKHKIRHDPRAFRISRRTERHKKQLDELEIWQKKYIFEALTPDQKREVLKKS